MSTKHASKSLTRESLAKLVTVSLTIEPETLPIGEAGDAQDQAWVRDQLDIGNEWAWCCVMVRAEYDGAAGHASLGGCSYQNRKAFDDSGETAQLTSEALDDLWSKLEARTPAGRAKAMAASSSQAITTSYRGPTDSNDSRVIARCEAKRISVPWDHALDPGANHAAAALQLMDQLGWSERNDLVMGGTREGYVFVQVPKRSHPVQYRFTTTNA